MVGGGCCPIVRFGDFSFVSTNSHSALSDGAGEALVVVQALRLLGAVGGAGDDDDGDDVAVAVDESVDIR